MSGISGMGQRWQAALKIWVIMIPLPENMAAGAASGVCYSGKGCCKVSGSRLGGPAYSGPRRGRGNENPWQGEMLYVLQRALWHGAWELFCGESRF